MADMEQTPRSFADRLQSMGRQTIYLILAIVVSASVLASYLFGIRVPNKPAASAQDFFATIMSVPEGSTVFLQSDFTNSTRGESAGQFEALLRVLMRRNIKFVVFCGSGDPQAPQVALDAINRINLERKAKGERMYERWNDYVTLGLYTDGRAMALSMMADLSKTIEGRKDSPPGQPPRDVRESPVLQNIKKIDDVALYIVITASKTTDIIVERLKFAPVQYGDIKVNSKIGAMVTGVMGPETLNYYKSDQMFGLIIGLNGAVEMETLMEGGINAGALDKNRAYQVGGFQDQTNYARGMSYYFALHSAMTLLIVFVIIGNVGMFLNKRKGGRG